MSPNFAKVEMYAGVTDRMGVENGTAGDPTFVTTVPMLGAGTTASWGANYCRRLSAYFIPPTTGVYDFFIASDDVGDFFLSTNDQPATKRIIANETGWSGVGQWVTPGTGGSVWSQKRSDQYTNAASADLPVNPNGIQLTGGTRYYTEIVMHQGGGGDNVEGYWKLHSSPAPVNGAPDNFVGSVIGAPVPRRRSASPIRTIPLNGRDDPYAPPVVARVARGGTWCVTPLSWRAQKTPHLPPYPNTRRSWM